MLYIISLGIRQNMFDYINWEHKLTYDVKDCVFAVAFHMHNELLVLVYAPKIFANLRVLYGLESEFNKTFENPKLVLNISPKLRSRTINIIFTYDSKFIIKLLTQEKFFFYVSMLGDIFNHFCEHPNSFLPKITGLYKLYIDKKEYYLMVMPNIYSFEPKTIRIKHYDLKDASKSLHAKMRKPSSYRLDHEFETDWPNGITLPSHVYNDVTQIVEFDLNLLKSWNNAVFSFYIVVIPYKLETSSAYNNSSDLESDYRNIIKYADLAIQSTNSNEPNYKNGIIGSENGENLLIFIEMIEHLQIYRTRALGALENLDTVKDAGIEFGKIQPENHKERLMQFITEYAMFNE